MDLSGDIPNNRDGEPPMPDVSVSLKQLVDAVPLPSLAAGPSGRIRIINDAALQLFGYSADDVVGQPGEMLLPAELRAAHVAQRSQYFERPRVVPGTGRQLMGCRSDGTTFPVEIGLNPVRNTDGVFALCSIVDLSERLRAQHALRDSEALYESLIDTLPVNILRKDANGRFVFANRRYCETNRIALDDLLGKTDFDLFPEELARKYREDDERVMREGNVVEDVEKHRKPDGEDLYVHV
ncbi:MAG: PAS domain-containing protein [Planctomycetaceae bacterium]